MPRPAKRKDTTPVDTRAKRSTSSRRSSLRSADEPVTDPIAQKQVEKKSARTKKPNQQAEAMKTIAQQLNKVRLESNQPGYASSVTSMSSNHDPCYTFNGTSRGKMRDVIELHVKTKNGEAMKTNITHKVAFNNIFKQFGIPREQLNGIQLNWRGHPMIEFRIRDKIDIDKMPPKLSYKLESINEDGSRTVNLYECEVSGVRDPNAHRKKENPQERKRQANLGFAGLRWKEPDMQTVARTSTGTSGILGVPSLTSKRRSLTCRMKIQT